MNSLRTQLTLFWILLLAACGAIGVSMTVLYSSSVDAQVGESQAAAESACRTLAARHAKSVAADPAASGRLDLLQVLLHLVLVEVPRMEGGVWRVGEGSLAYAYPTYEGSGEKRDLPAAEQPLIAELATQAVRGGALRTDVVRGSREALIVTACPLTATGGLAAWTMTRATGNALAAQSTWRAGLAALVALVLGSALWLGWLMARGLRHVAALQRGLAQAEVDDADMPELGRTGVQELDRIVEGFNRFRVRLGAARARIREAELQRGRDLRLATLGRMTGAIAHEIRNPIAAMRLKAENALAGPVDRHRDALRSIVGQVDRLDGLVKSLLKLVQPIDLACQPVPLRAWLTQRLAAATPVDADAGQRPGLSLEIDPSVDTSDAPSVDGAAIDDGGCAFFDPVHLARAVDNLMDNALRHAAPGGRVTLRATRGERGSLLLQVDDDGAGVPESLRPMLFEPFASGRADGTGLGLALAREVAIAHGGDLRHVPLPRGTRFELELPCRAS